LEEHFLGCTVKQVAHIDVSIFPVGGLDGTSTSSGEAVLQEGDHFWGLNDHFHKLVSPSQHGISFNANMMKLQLCV
jgi:hypothetical protein